MLWCGTLRKYTLHGMHAKSDFGRCMAPSLVWVVVSLVRDVQDVWCRCVARQAWRRVAGQTWTGSPQGGALRGWLCTEWVHVQGAGSPPVLREWLCMLRMQGAGYPRWEGSHSGGAVGVDLHGVEHVQDMVE